MALQDWSPSYLEALVRVPREIAIAKRQFRGVKINDISELEPERKLRERLIYWAKKWLHDMELQGFRLITAESDILVFGPFMPRMTDTKKVAHAMILGELGWSGPGIQNARAMQVEEADFKLRATFIKRMPEFEYAR